AVVGEAQPVEHAAAIRIVKGDTLTADVGRPHRHASRIDGWGIEAGTHEAVDPAEEQAARVARPADLALVRRRVRERPQSWHLTELTDGHHDEGRTAQHEYVAVLIRARDD